MGLLVGFDVNDNEVLVLSGAGNKEIYASGNIMNIQLSLLIIMEQF